MLSRRQPPGSALSMRATLAILFLTSFLFGSISIWRVHRKYLRDLGGWGIYDGDDAPLLDGEWLPEAPEVGATGRMRLRRNREKGRRKSNVKTKQKMEKPRPSTNENANAKQNRVYCMVPFIWTPSALPTYHDIHASWGKRCDILRFFIDPVIGDPDVGFYNMTEISEVIAAKDKGMILPEDDVVILHDMRRPWHTCNSESEDNKNERFGNCRNIFEKVWRMIVFTARNGADEAEWFVKVDADTFLFPDHVGPFVESKKWSHEEHHYFGHVLNHRVSDRGVSIVAGGAVFFSRATLLAGADAFRNMPMDKGDEEEDGTCRDAYTGTEEVVTAACLKEHSGIIAEPALDPDGREEVMIYQVDNLIDYNRTEQGEWWFWEGKKKFPCHDDGDCIADLPLAFHHYKNSKDFLNFEKEFYGSVMKGEDDGTLFRSKDGKLFSRRWPGDLNRQHRYFERVRGAMKAAKSETKKEDHIALQIEKEVKQSNRLERTLLPKKEKQSTIRGHNQISQSTKSQAKKEHSSTNIPHNNRVYCMVPFIWTPSAMDKYAAIRATWGKRCHILRFFIDSVIGDAKVGYFNMTEPSGVIAAKKAGLSLPDDVVILHSMRRPWHTNCGLSSAAEDEKRLQQFGNCRNIWEKIWKMNVYVASGSGGARVRVGASKREDDHETDAYKAEWFVKVDTDTFLFPENVGRYVEARKWSHNDHHYFGHVLSHRKDTRGVSTVAGGAVFYSRATLLASAKIFENMPMDKGHKEEDGTCRDAYTGTEEMVTATCLKEHSNIIADPAIDPEGRELVSLYEVDDILGYNRTEQGEWWFWKNKKRFPCHDNGDCLAHLPLAFHHYKDAQDLIDLEKEFYGSVIKGENDKTLFRTNDGRVAARRWPKFDMTYKYFEKVRAALKVAEDADTQLLAMSKNSQPSHQNKNLSDHRLYCMVPFIWTPKYIPSYHGIHKTWGKRCDVLKFMIDPIVGDNETGYLDLRTSGKGYELPDDVVVLDIQRPWHVCPKEEGGVCRNIWEKVWRSWVWVDSHGGADLADWFVKVDADSYLFPENMKHYVIKRGWSPDDQHYFGHILKHRARDIVPIIAGAAVFFSRATFKAAANIFRRFDAVVEPWNDVTLRGHLKCQDAYTDQEEIVTAVCLKEHMRVDAYPLLDEMGQELVTIGEIEDVLLWNRTEQGEWWYWKNKPRKHPKTGKDMHQCCGDLPVAFHGYRDPQWFFKLENELYSEVSDDKGNGWKNYRWRHPVETNRYFGRVRMAMKDVSRRGS